MLKGISRDTTMAEIRQRLSEDNDLEDCARRIRLAKDEIIRMKDWESPFEYGPREIASWRVTHIEAALKGVLEKDWDSMLDLQEDGADNLAKMTQLIQLCSETLPNNPTIAQLKAKYTETEEKK